MTRQFRIPLMVIGLGAGCIGLGIWLSRPTTPPPMECGPIALFHVCQADGKRIDLGELSRAIRVGENGTTLLELKQAAESLGFGVVGVKVSAAGLVEFMSHPQRYAILHMNGNHFVAVLGLTPGGELRVVDAYQQPDTVPPSELPNRGWGGVALFLTGTSQVGALTPADPVVHLGKVPLGEKKPFRTSLRNATGETVQIARIDSGCGCINIGLSNPQIAAGGLETVSGEFHATGGPGAFRKRVTVHAAGANRKPSSFEITGEVLAMLSVVPSEVVLHPDYKTGRGATAAVRVKNDSGQEVTYTVPPTPGITVSPATLCVPAGAAADLTISVPPEHAVEERLELDVTTTYANEPLLRLPVRISPVAPVRVEPAALSLGVGTKKEMLAHKGLALTLSGAGVGELALDGFECPPFLAVSKQERAPDGRMVIRFEVVDRFPSIGLTGRVVLRLRSTETGRTLKEHVVPVSGVLRDGT